MEQPFTMVRRYGRNMSRNASKLGDVLYSTWLKFYSANHGYGRRTTENLARFNRLRHKFVRTWSARIAADGWSLADQMNALFVLNEKLDLEFVYLHRNISGESVRSAENVMRSYASVRRREIRSAPQPVVGSSLMRQLFAQPSPR